MPWFLCGRRATAAGTPGVKPVDRACAAGYPETKVVEDELPKPLREAAPILAHRTVPVDSGKIPGEVARGAEPPTDSKDSTSGCSAPPSDSRRSDSEFGGRLEDGSAMSHSEDHLDWVPPSGSVLADGCALRTGLSSSIAVHRTTSRRITGGKLRTQRSLGLVAAALIAGEDVTSDTEDEDERSPNMCHRVQVLFDDGWRDFSESESKQICDFLANEVFEFRLSLRGHEYRFNFTKFVDASQVNVKSGKRRRLRILDGPVAKEELEGDTHKPPSPEALLQQKFGPQSKRGGASQTPIAKYLEGNKHAQTCFEQFEKNEIKYCGEWAVCYHSYSFAALIYEVHAAVASVLFRFRSSYAALPRILVHQFHEIPNAGTLIAKFKSDFAENKRDHNPGFRQVGISAMSSLASTGPEACTARVFVSGYSCKDVSFKGVLESVLEACHVPPEKVANLASNIINLSEKHGLDVSQFGGKPCKSQKAGHLMQVFVKRDLVDELVYAAEPYGRVDLSRMPVSKWVNSNVSSARGQVRIVAHPKFFMQANCVRMFVASADPTFHRNRRAFQEELCHLIKELGDSAMRERAAACIYGGTLPSWWTSEDQRNLA